VARAHHDVLTAAVAEASHNQHNSLRAP
jgi:hypothetical protein